MRNEQIQTLEFIKGRRNGVTIKDVSEKFKIRTTSARSRLVRLADNGMLDEFEEPGPRGLRLRFKINKDGKSALRAA